MAEKDDFSPQKAGDGKYTPPNKRPGTSGTEEGTIVVRTPAKGNRVSMQFPQLTDSNYQLWAAKMKILLRALGVWSAIGCNGEVEEEKDNGAMAAISQAVPDDVMMAIAEFETAREAWDAIRMMRIGEERVTKAQIQQLTRRFDRLTMEEGETVTVFSRRLTALVGEIRALGEKLPEKAVVKRLFAAMPERFSQIIGTIEQWGDIKNISVSEAIGRLRTFEENETGKRREYGENTDQLLLVAKALGALMNKKENCSDGTSSSGEKKTTSWDSEHYRRDEKEGKHKKHRKFDKSKIRCFNCDLLGHFASECREPKREEANLAVQDSDDEPALLMAEVCELVHTAEASIEQVQLKKEKVPKKSDDKKMSWYLDNEEETIGSEVED